MVPTSQMTIMSQLILKNPPFLNGGHRRKLSLKEIDLFTEPPSFGHLAIPHMLQSSFLAHDKLILKSRPF